MSPRNPRLSALAALAAAGLLGACQSDGVTTGSVGDYPADLRARHPIVLADAPRSLDVFVTGVGHLDPRQSADIAAFALEYRRYGRGAVAVQVPTGVGPAAGATAYTVSGIRRVLAENGVPAGAVAVSTYPATIQGAVSAVRVSFQRMQAKVSSECGLWPEDLGTGSYEFGARNGPYYNFGCAMQSNVAAQIADPVDLVRGRQEGRIDTLRRTKDIDQLRQGKDPSTQWRQDGQASVKQQLQQ